MESHYALQPLSLDEARETFSRLVTDRFTVYDVTADAGSPPSIRLRGRFLLPTDEAYPVIADRFRNAGYTALFRREGGDDLILALPGLLPEHKPNWRRSLILFLLTLLSTLFVGATMNVSEVFPDNLWHPIALLGFLFSGWPYAVSLLGILTAHELGHYLVSRRLGTPVSPPYFIPMPIGLGTMGAFISMKAPPVNRRSLLLIAVAGPFTGLIVALPILVLGLTLSTVVPFTPGQEILLEGNSLLYLLIKWLLFGQLLPTATMDVMIHPVAFAGWVGILVTAMNLIPAGQLDGGHVAYALFGSRARWITQGVIVILFLLGFLWSGWFLWAFLVFTFGRINAAPLDDLTPLKQSQRLLALAALILFVLVFTPIPFRTFVP